MQETWVQSLGQGDPLEKRMATHSSILAWRTPRTKEPHGPKAWGCGVGHDWSDGAWEHCSLHHTCPVPSTSNKDQTHRKKSAGSSGKLITLVIKTVMCPTKYKKWHCVFIHLGIAPQNWLLSQLVTIFSLELAKESILTRLLGNSLVKKLRINLPMC